MSSHLSDRTTDLCLRARVANGIDRRLARGHGRQETNAEVFYGHISEQLQSSTHTRCQQVLKCTQVHTLSFAFLVQAAGLPFSIATHLERD